MSSLVRTPEVVRVHLLLRGIVQGVGFRPYAFSLASRFGLRGRLMNNSSGVFIDIEGESKAVERFLTELHRNPPPLSAIEESEVSGEMPPVHYPDLKIIESSSVGENFVPISPDVTTCDECLKELFDPSDRRYRYPFLNCTNCGPRFSIIKEIPYDRGNTTMRRFAMCPECREEYQDPLDRRFHAEPTACPVCGPRLRFVAGEPDCDMAKWFADPIARTLENLSAGKVVAIKGIGGFHLACDALNRDAVETLRRRKYREDKPFALMAKSIEIVQKHCYVSKAEEEVLNSRTRPIVLLPRRGDSNMPGAIAPGINSLGFMLPYSPLHHLLVERLDEPLVMTSANISDEPICYRDDEALNRLSGIADCFLLHDRTIHMRTDDSVVRVQAGREMILRRSRGYAPAPIRTRVKFKSQILACGAELKNTFCFARDNSVFLSHHIGDLKNLETARAFEEGIRHFKKFFHLDPKVVAYDLHPEYLSSKYALGLESVQTIGVQHHHAHVASCMADNDLDGEVIGVAMDGVGYGEDGCFWGGEFFIAGYREAFRIAHLDYVPMPGGAAAIREPWRIAAVYLHRALGNSFLELDLPCTKGIDKASWHTLRSMVKSGTNCPQTSSIGRLFDAVASIVGLRNSVNYEGQAAIELESIATARCDTGYNFQIENPGCVIKADTAIREIVEDLLNGVSPAEVSGKFHVTLARMIALVCCRAREESRLDRVVLSGGVFQNILLLDSATQLLRASGFQVFTHSRVPANDGGLALGQAAIANARLQGERIER